MKARSAVIVSRKWQNPKIAVTVNADGISIGIELSQFLTSLAEEVGSPATLFSKQALKAKLEEAASKVISEMKDVTKHVV